MSHYVLKLSGNRLRHVAECRLDLERNLSGRVVNLKGDMMQICLQNMNRRVGDGLEQLERIFGVVIISDESTPLPELRVFGSPARDEGVTREVHRLLEDVDTLYAPIAVRDPADLRWIVGGGSRLLKSQIGRTKVFFVWDWKVIFVSGSDGNYAEATFLLKRRLLDLPVAERECAVCLCVPEAPLLDSALRTSCYHVYCKPCFSWMCLWAARQSRAIACIGDSGNCNTVFSLREIHRNVFAETFEEILTASFSSYISTHPQELRHCPTPDCDQTYRVSSDPTMTPATFTCMRCHHTLCSGCHASHPGMTCEQHNGGDLASDIEALNRVKRMMGAKDCRNCGASMVKTEGCDHVKCWGCQIHICWRCEATFDEAGACVDHLQQVHGG